MEPGALPEGTFDGVDLSTQLSKQVCVDTFIESLRNALLSGPTTVLACGR